MPREQNSSVSDDRDHCDQDKCFEDRRACIVCPPCDYREKFESSFSDRSCPDFSELCEDKPKICCEKKKLCKRKSDSSESDDGKRKKKSYKRDSSESDESDDEKHKRRNKKNKRGCKGCEARCNNCARCQSCGCKQCSDFSRTSVVDTLGSDSSSGCPEFNKLACDQKKKCCEIVSLCKKKHNVKSESDKKSEESKHDKHDNKKAFESADSVERKEKSSTVSTSKGKKFVVSFGCKQVHPWAEYNCEEKSIHINGKNGPVLHLYRGCTYFFCVEQEKECKHELILTNSPAGGEKSSLIPNGFPPVSKGCVCFKVDKHTPRYFFYQDAKNAFAGGLVIVHDK